MANFSQYNIVAVADNVIFRKDHHIRPGGGAASARTLIGDRPLDIDGGGIVDNLRGCRYIGHREIGVIIWSNIQCGSRNIVVFTRRSFFENIVDIGNNQQLVGAHGVYRQHY